MPIGIDFRYNNKIILGSKLGFGAIPSSDLVEGIFYTPYLGIAFNNVDFSLGYEVQTISASDGNITNLQGGINIYFK